MARMCSNRLWIHALLLLVCSVVGYAANIDKAITDAEGRRRAAENGLREIKTKSHNSIEEVHSAYSAAAASQNAWLDQVCKAIEDGSAATDITSTAQSAAASLIAWVATRNRALGVPVMTKELEDGAKGSIARDLVEIANATWKAARGSNPQQRQKTSASFRERLRWKSWDEI